MRILCVFLLIFGCIAGIIAAQPPPEAMPFFLGPELAAAVTCQPGFHRVGADCLANVACRLGAAGSCSGHGVCHDTTGFPTCLCHPGFASTGTGQCNACDSSLHVYPFCFSHDMIDELQAATLLTSTASAAVYTQISATDAVVAMPNKVARSCQYSVLPDTLDAVGLLSPYGPHGGAVQVEVRYLEKRPRFVLIMTVESIGCRVAGFLFHQYGRGQPPDDIYPPAH